tara:strand:+ start:380 stop:517 length:138 start_codon:yes stop_codon:yes gene_type:complete
VFRSYVAVFANPDISSQLINAAPAIIALGAENIVNVSSSPGMPNS